MQLQGLEQITGRKMLTQEQEWDNAHPTPPFVVRKFDEHKKLSGHKNYRIWRNMIDIDLKALGLLPFINSENAAEVQLSE